MYSLFQNPLPEYLIENVVYARMIDVVDRANKVDMEINLLREQLDNCLNTIDALSGDLKHAVASNKTKDQQIESQRQSIIRLSGRVDELRESLNTHDSINTRLNQQVSYLTSRLQNSSSIFDPTAPISEAGELKQKLAAAENTIKQLRSDERNSKLKSDNARLNSVVAHLSASLNRVREANEQLVKSNNRLIKERGTHNYGGHPFDSVADGLTALDKRLRVLESAVNAEIAKNIMRNLSINPGPRVR